MASMGLSSGLEIVGRAAFCRAGVAGFDSAGFGSVPGWEACESLALGGSSVGGSSGGGSWAAAAPASERNRYSDRTVTSLDIAGSRLDWGHDARVSKASTR
jgi:hypothetical protein